MKTLTTTVLAILLIATTTLTKATFMLINIMCQPFMALYRLIFRKLLPSAISMCQLYLDVSCCYL